MEGPDQTIPVNNYITWKIDGAVKLRIDRSGPASVDAISVPTLMNRAVEKAADKPALIVRDPKTNEERVWTWKGYRNEVRNVAKAFIYYGLERFESVSILGFNSPEWVISDVAAIHAGGTSAGIYPTNGPEACEYILKDSNCSILVVEDDNQLNKVWNIVKDSTQIKKIIQYSGKVMKPGVVYWDDCVKQGEFLPDDDLQDRLKRMAVNQVCKLVYTSGTTGNPKGVMLSQDTITWTTWISLKMHKFNMDGNDERTLSYLPLSHIAGNLVDIWAMMGCAGTTYFADKNVMKTTLKENLHWCRPTRFLGVPRVWEKLMEKMQELGKSTKGLKKVIATKAKKTGLEHHLNHNGGKKFEIFQKIVFSAIKLGLGFDQCRGFYSGAAPLANVTFRYFLSLDIKILELYGLSETSGPLTFQLPEQFRENSVGVAIESVKIKLERSSDPEIEAGEIWGWGRNIMMGYLNRQDATQKDMTDDGWFKTGDLGEIDRDGFHFIVGREKDLIITGGGENVAPKLIQEKIQEELPIIAHALVLGDKQKFISCFLTLAVEVNPDTMEPSRRLTSAAIEWCRSIGSTANTVTDVLKGPDSRIMRGIQAGIDRANKKAVSNASRVQKWMVLPQDFSVPGGELGPTLKVKRQYITKRYQKSIEKIYDV